MSEHICDTELHELALCDLDIDWIGCLPPFAVQPFEVDKRGASSSLRFCVDTRREHISLPEAECVSSIFRFGRDHKGRRVVWNQFADDPRLFSSVVLSGESAQVYCRRGVHSCSILNMFLVAFLPVVARNNGLLFHASLVEYEGRAVAFTASSGTGKSTQADLWHEHLGAEIMNGDRAFVRRFDDEWRAYGSPWAGSSPYIKNVKAPLAGIVVLKQAPENRIRRLNAAEVMAYLYNNVRYPFWDEGATAASLETLDALIREIPIFLLECRPDEEAVRITRDAIFGK